MRQSLRERVRRVLSDGRWHTGLELAHACGESSYTTGVAAKVRDLRKPAYGGCVIAAERDVDESSRTGRQVWRFRMALGLCTAGTAPRGGAPSLAAAGDGQLVLASDVVEPHGHWQRG
jgi:hypothetical protein